MPTPPPEFEQSQKHQSREPIVMSKNFLTLWLVIIFVWVVMLIYALWLLIAPSRPSPADPGTGLILTQTSLPSLFSTATTPIEIFSTPTFLFSAPVEPSNQLNLPTTLPTAINPPTAISPPPTPLPGSILLSLTPPAGSVGWTSSIDGQSHFDDGKIHVGFFRGHVYHGAIQFDLSSVSPDSKISYAALELTGLSDKNLGVGGVWQVRLLDPTLDESWVALTYDKLRQAHVASTLEPVMPGDSLARNITYVFPLNEEQLAILTERLKTRRISFRIDGPGSGLDNLFTWNNGSGDKREPGDDALTEAEQLAQTGQPVLKIIVEGSKYVIITSTPTPENILTVAAQLNDPTTPTPLPPNWVTPVVVTSVPPPANAVTATYLIQVVTAEAVVYGTATSTPENVWTATPTSVIIPLPEGKPTSSVSPTPTPAPIPEILVGKIAFLSDRAEKGQPLAYVMDAGGSNVALLTDQAIYEALVARDRFAAHQEFLAFAREVKHEDGQQRPAIFYYDYLANRAEQVTGFHASRAYQPAWSPTQERIAFVSNDSGTEEIWAVNRDKSDLSQLTRDDPTALDGHPSWSPDGSLIVFWSNRTGRKQIWVMNANGSGPRHLHQSDFNDWDPIWIKYTDLVARPVPAE
jgi:hypothetical protein